MFLIILIAFLYGCATVISKMINYRAAQELGTWNGSLVNYVVASILALILLIFFQNVTWIRFAGILLVSAGIFWDKKVTAA